MTEYREIEFIPADWVSRAAFWPGLEVYSRPVSIPIDTDCSQRRKTDRGTPTLTIDKVEQLPETPEAILDRVERLLGAYDE